MDHPVKEIPHVIHSLTQGSPSEQQRALEIYWLPNAAFHHPFCRVSSFSDFHIPAFGVINSRWIIWLLYRWYKILSPHITLTVNSVTFDQRHELLYVSISQVFAYFLIPFWKINVSLVTVLKLAHDPDTNKFYIAKQEDLYQPDEFVKFFVLLPGFSGVLFVLQWVATVVSAVGATLLSPLTALAESRAERSKQQ